MADIGGRTRIDGSREMASITSYPRPVPMKLFATWEVERTSPNCVPRICSLTLTRLEVLKQLEGNIGEVMISVSMQSSRRTLRSNEIVLPPSGLIDTELDLSFSLQVLVKDCQKSIIFVNLVLECPGKVLEFSLSKSVQTLIFVVHHLRKLWLTGISNLPATKSKHKQPVTTKYPHFLKRSGNNLQIMLQRRKKYKNRTILGFKTLAVGLVNMGQVLQCSMENQLKLYAKGSSAPVAQVTVSQLSSQPVDADLDRMQGTSGRGTDGDDNSSDDDDDFYLSDQEGSDLSGPEDIMEIDQQQGQKLRRRKFRIPIKHQKNFKQKFFALLKKFKVTDEVLAGQPDTYLDMDISPPENEVPDDDFLFEMDDDSEGENEFMEDTISITSTPKPSLRPFFDARSTENVPSKTVSINVEEGSRAAAQHCLNIVNGDDNSTDPELLLDTFTPPSETETSESPVNSDSMSPNRVSPQGSSSSSSVRRSVSFKERAFKVDDSAENVSLKRRNSDIELKLPVCTLNDQLLSVLPPNDTIPESILLVNTSEWQGQLLALKLWDRERRIICTRSNADIQSVFLAIISKYQQFCNSHSVSPPVLRVAVAGTEPYVSAVVRPYIEHFSSKPPDWQSYIRFLIIPLGSHPLAKYLSALDSTYNSLFMDSVWKEAFEHSDSAVDFEEVGKRVSTYMAASTVTHSLPVAEALVNTKHKGMDEGSSQVFLPFVSDVRIGSTDYSQDEELLTSTSGTLTTASKEIPGSSGSRGELQVPMPGLSLSPPQSTTVYSKESGTSSPVPGSELFELQVDYWLIGGNKKEPVTKSSLKTTFKSLVVTRLPTVDEPTALNLVAVTKERKKGFEARMRLKKSKEKDSENRNQPVTASVSKLICTTKGQSSTLNVLIDGVTWSGVKFFSLSSQWPTHVKQFPVGLFARVETSC